MRTLCRFVFAPSRSAWTDRIAASFLPLVNRPSGGSFQLHLIASSVRRTRSFYFSPSRARSFRPFDGCLFSCPAGFILLIRKERIFTTALRAAPQFSPGTIVARRERSRCIMRPANFENSCRLRLICGKQFFRRREEYQNHETPFAVFIANDRFRNTNKPISMEKKKTMLFLLCKVKVYLTMPLDIASSNAYLNMYFREFIPFVK